MNSMIMVHGIPDGSTAAEIEADPRMLQLERHSPGKTDLQKGAQEVYRNWRP